MVAEAIARMVEGQDLTADEAEAVMTQIVERQVTPAQVGAFLTALRMRGETVEEIVGCARALRREAIPVRP